MGIFSFFKKKKNSEIINDNSISSRAEFVREMKTKGVGLKSALMEHAALSKDLKVKRLSRRLILIEKKNGSFLAFTHMNGINSSRIGMNLCDRKHDSRYILDKSGLKVVESKLFSYNSFKNAIKYANKIGYPVVVKPTSLSRGRGVTAKIQNDEEFKRAWDNAFIAYKSNRKIRNVIVERYINGEDYRVFVIGDKVVSVTQRKRANIVGDGTSTVLELIRKKNEERSKNPYLCNYLISEDSHQLDYLTKQNYQLDFIPKSRQEVVLRSQSNISAGRDSIDLTDSIHKEFRDIAIKAVQSIPGINYAGVDFIAQDITVKPSRTLYVVSEIEFSPAPLAQFPYKGKSRDIAGEILNYYLNQK